MRQTFRKRAFKNRESKRSILPNTRFKDVYRPGVTALNLFANLKYGTDQIANYLGITEAEAEKRLTLERSAALGLPSPYEVRG